MYCIGVHKKVKQQGGRGITNSVSAETKPNITFTLQLKVLRIANKLIINV